LDWMTWMTQLTFWAPARDLSGITHQELNEVFRALVQCTQ
jgi:hypothetical protein